MKIKKKIEIVSFRFEIVLEVQRGYFGGVVFKIESLYRL